MQLVREACHEEVDLVKRKGIYEYAKIEDCTLHTGKSPPSARWVDKNKGTAEVPNARCRLVPIGFNLGNSENGLYAPIPPLEAKKTSFAKTAEKYGRWCRGQGGAIGRPG